MGTIDRRAFLKKAALACPLLAAGGGWLRGTPQQQKAKPGDEDFVVAKSRCTGCGECVPICPVNAIALKNGKAVIDPKECIECEACVDECPAEAIMRRKDLAKAEADDKKPKPEKDVNRPPAVDPIFDNAGVWIMTGTFDDGSTHSEAVRFVGTTASGVIRNDVSNENEGTYTITGTQVELRLPEGQVAKGRIISADRLEGTLPFAGGRWRAERKKRPGNL